MKILACFFAGLLFSFGLMVSGMINPAKVLNFLDVTGSWDPSLAFVMGGAVLVTFFGYRVVLNRSGPLFESAFSIPTRSDIDFKLIAGATLFGAGWGLVGICPGPAIAAFAAAPLALVLFLVAMLVGMSGQRLIARKVSIGG